MTGSSGLSTDLDSVSLQQKLLASIGGHALESHAKVSRLLIRSNDLLKYLLRVYYTIACGSLYWFGRVHSWPPLATIGAEIH